MTVTVHADEVNLDVRVRGWASVWGLARHLTVPRSAIVSAEVRPTRELKRTLGWRVGGTYLPGVIAAGWYTWRGRKGLRQWWSVGRAPEVLVVDTSLRRPARLVIETDDRHRLAAELSP